MAPYSDLMRAGADLPPAELEALLLDMEAARLELILALLQKTPTDDTMTHERVRRFIYEVRRAGIVLVNASEDLLGIARSIPARRDRLEAQRKQAPPDP